MSNWMEDNIREIVRSELNNRDFEHLVVQGWIDTAYAGTGSPKVRFIGEDQVSGKTYTCLKEYTPTAGDRVILARLGGDYVILGSI